MRDPITKMLLGRRKKLDAPSHMKAKGVVKTPMGDVQDGEHTVIVYLGKNWLYRVSWGVPGVAASWRHFSFYFATEALGFFMLLVHQHDLTITDEEWRGGA